MPKFEDFMESFSYNPETFNEAEFKAAVKAAHDDDVNSVNTVVAAKDQTIGELQGKVTKLGADNWTLLMKQGTPIPANNDSGSHADHEEEEAELPRLSDAFKKVE